MIATMYRMSISPLKCNRRIVSIAKATLVYSQKSLMTVREQMKTLLSSFACLAVVIPDPVGAGSAAADCLPLLVSAMVEGYSIFDDEDG